MKVLTPAPQVLESRFPELLGGKVAGGEVAAVTEAPGFYVAPNGQPMYRIGSHDTLTTIARAHLGRSSRWIQIYELNRDHLKSPEELQIGTSLRLPLDASSVRVSNAPVERR